MGRRSRGHRPAAPLSGFTRPAALGTAAGWQWLAGYDTAGIELRILHVVPTYLPATRYGGPIRSIHGLCRALSRRGHDVGVFTTSVDGRGDSPVPIGTPVDLEGVSIRYFRSPRLRRLYWAPELAATLAREAAGFDIIHTHSLFLWPTTAAAAAARRAGVPYVVAPRGMLVQQLIRAKSRFSKLAWIAMFERQNLERAAAIHVTTELERRECERFGFALPGFVVLPNGIDVDSSHPGAQSRPTSPTVERAMAPGPYVLFLGRLSWKKGIDRLLAALPLLPDIDLVVAGNDDEALQPKLVRRSVDLGVAERVHFVGPVTGADKAALLAGCTALAAPSLSENFGNVVLEAMAAGRPVVTTPGVGLAEAVERWQAGLVCAAEPVALAAALGRLISDPALAARCGENGRRAVAAEFTWDKVAKLAEAAYVGLLESGSERAATVAAQA